MLLVLECTVGMPRGRSWPHQLQPPPKKWLRCFFRDSDPIKRKPFYFVSSSKSITCYSDSKFKFSFDSLFNYSLLVRTPAVCWGDLGMESQTLTGLLKKVAAEFPERRAVSVSGKFDLTHAQLNELVDQAAAHLITAGVTPGEVVALTFPNSVEVCHLIGFSVFQLIRSQLCKWLM